MKLPRAYFLFLLSPILPLLTFLLGSDCAYLTRDIALSYLPAKKFLVDALLKLHSVPSWNPLAFGGAPYRADLNNSPLHPLNFLFLLFPDFLDKGYLLFVGAHLLLFAFGSYLLFLRCRFGQKGSLAAALVLSLSGMSFSTVSLMNMACSLAALPYFFYFLLPLRKKFSWRNFLGTATAWVWPVYGGDPQFSYWMALAATGLVLQGCALERSLQPILRTAGAGLLAIGLSAAQLLPAVGLALSSDRGLGALTLNHAERFSLHPLRLLELFFPLPFGNIGIGEAWIGKLTDKMFTIPLLLHIYLGVVVGAFSFWNLFRLTKKAPSRKKLIIVAFLIFLLLAALGKYSFVDVYGFLFSFLPGWRMFRYPERLIFLFGLLLIVWNGSMFRWVAWKLSAHGAAAKDRLLFLSAALFIFALALFGIQGTVRLLEVHTLSGSLMHVFLLSALFSLLCYFRGKLAFVRKHSFVIFCFLILLDGLPFGFSLLWQTSADQVPFRKNEFAEKIHLHISGRPEQIKVGAATRYFHGTYRGPFPTTSHNPLQIGQAWDWGVMYPNISMYFGIANPAGYSTFDPKGLIALWARRGNSDPQRLLNVFSIAYYPLAAGDRPSLQYNPSALPLAWFPSSVSFVKEEASAEGTLFAPGFSYLTGAVAVGGAEEWKQSGKSWIVRDYSRTPDHARIEVLPLSSESFFVWNERFNPSWKAFYQGKELPISLTNTWAMGVKLSGGQSSGPQLLEFIYEDSAESWGNWITTVTLLLILIGSIGIRLLPYRHSRE